ncbi:hypothetical protein NHQ30_008974 [Ciborinia camelliae]|nr:hypothetical protein NHQ30_008974 [Ciborinia camelliae]
MDLQDLRLFRVLTRVNASLPWPSAEAKSEFERNVKTMEEQLEQHQRLQKQQQQQQKKQQRPRRPKPPEKVQKRSQTQQRTSNQRLVIRSKSQDTA